MSVQLMHDLGWALIWFSFAVLIAGTAFTIYLTRPTKRNEQL